jgi:hypothetical protein
MKALVRLGLASAILVLGCSSSGKTATPQYDNSSKAVAQALTTGLEVDNGKLKSGSLPATTADNVSVMSDSDTVTLKPSGTAIMSLSVDNPDESKDPVTAMLMQFQDTDQHFEVPRDKGDGGLDQNGKVMLMSMFKVDTAICKDFCNKSFEVTLQMAVKLDSGKISQHAEQSFTLDCTKDGDKNKCGEIDAGKPSGTGGKTSTKPDAGKPADAGTINDDAEKLAQQVVMFNLAVCGCNGGMRASYCDPMGYSMSDVKCLTTAARKALDATTHKNTRVTCDIMAVSNYVTMCQSSCTTCTYQGLGDALRMSTTSACRMMPEIPGLDACMLKLGDAGMPKDAGGTADAGAKDSGMKP